MQDITYKLSNEQGFTFAYIETDDDVSKEKWNSDASQGVVNDYESISDIPFDLNEDSPFYVRYKDEKGNYCYVKLTIISLPTNNTFTIEVLVDNDNKNNSFSIEYEDGSEYKWKNLKRNRNKISLNFSVNYSKNRRYFYLFIQSNVDANSYKRLYFEQDILSYGLDINSVKHYLDEKEIEESLWMGKYLHVVFQKLTPKDCPNEEELVVEFKDWTDYIYPDSDIKFKTSFLIESIKEFKYVGAWTATNFTVGEDDKVYVEQTKIVNGTPVKFWQEGLNFDSSIYVLVDYDDGLYIKKKDNKTLSIVSNGLCTLYNKVLYQIVVCHSLERKERACLFIELEKYL